MTRVKVNARKMRIDRMLVVNSVVEGIYNKYQLKREN